MEGKYFLEKDCYPVSSGDQLKMPIKFNLQQSQWGCGSNRISTKSPPEYEWPIGGLEVMVGSGAASYIRGFSIPPTTTRRVSMAPGLSGPMDHCRHRRMLGKASNSSNTSRRKAEPRDPTRDQPTHMQKGLIRPRRKRPVEVL